MGGGDEASVTANNGAENDKTNIETAAAEEVGAGDEVTINIRCSNGSKFSVKASLESNVGSFKSVLEQQCDIPAGQQRLIYKGRILKDDQSLRSYGLEADHTIHMVRGFGAPAPAPNTTPAATPTPATGDPGVPRDAGQNEDPTVGGLGASLRQRLGFNLFGSGIHSMEELQQQFTQNPNMMQDILNMPAVQSIVNNPEIIRNVIMNNSQMRDILDRNPELGHILNDPATLRQTFEAARNPEIMREMMRNTDRAMSNIESSPEGFNMLRRMYENVQEPFLNATTQAAGENRGGGSGANPFAALLGTQGGGPGRDQSTNPATAGTDSTNSPAPNTNPLPNPWASTGTGVAQTNTTARSTPAGEARPLPTGGLGGLAFPDLEGMLGTVPDPDSFNQMMQNPAISQMFQNFISNPQNLNQVISSNPELRSMTESNPLLRDMLQNPEFIRQMSSPETIQQLLAFQQLFPQIGRQPTTQESGQNAGGAAGAFDLEMLMNMFGGLGTVPNRSNVPPEELYATQLTQLQEMGFFDTQENLRALIATNGNVHAAVERLLGNLG